MSDQATTLDASAAPDWFRDLMAEWLVKHGPDGHNDGYEIIADLAWQAANASRDSDSDCLDE